jgi:hypothetical protein
MLLWAISTVLGFIALVFLPAMLGLIISILTRIGKRHPRMADIGAMISILIVFALAAGLLYLFTIMFHFLIIGKL